MLMTLALVFAQIGQPPMSTQPQFFDDNVRLMKDLPAEQFDAAKQIIFLGGDVSRDPKVWTTAESIGLSGGRFTDAELRLLRPFRGSSLQGLAFVRAKLSEDGIARALENFPSLKSVTIFQMPVGDLALEPLADFGELEYVELGETKITSASLRHFAHQPHLQYLTISETAIDDDGLKHLEGLSKLKSLFSGKTRITSAGLASIAKVTSLESLLLNDTVVDDEGLKHLTPLKKLKTLRLDGTRVTNVGMAHIAKLTSLKDLDVERTKVDAQGLALLQNLPKLQEVRWVDKEKATLEEKRFHARFHLYLPANAERWKDAREKFERGELEIK